MGEKINICGLPVEVVSEEKIHEEKCPVVAVRLQDALLPLDEKYFPGTKGGYFCSFCNAECILAPSGQKILAEGEHNLVCFKCLLTVLEGGTA